MNAIACIDAVGGVIEPSDSARYARMVRASKCLRWEIDADVLRGRRFDPACKFLPDEMSHADHLSFLTRDERHALTHVQARTYASLSGTFEQVAAAKVLQLSGRHRLGDRHALEALLRFAEEERKHETLFGRVEVMLAAQMAPGYARTPQLDTFARAALATSTWALLALILHGELLVQSHCAQAMDADTTLSPLWKDIFVHHWQEECQHVVLDELEWTREDRTLTPARRDAAVEHLIDLLLALDRALQAQAGLDARYFTAGGGRIFADDEQREVGAVLLRAYRWQYLLCGAQHPHFKRLLQSLTTPRQQQRIESALATIGEGGLCPVWLA